MQVSLVIVGLKTDIKLGEDKVACASVGQKQPRNLVPFLILPLRQHFYGFPNSIKKNR